jgi:hypothetical protein
MPNAAAKTRSSRSERVDDDTVDMAGLTYAQFVNHPRRGRPSGTQANFLDRASKLTLPGISRRCPFWRAKKSPSPSARIWGSKSEEIRLGALRRANISSPLVRVRQDKRYVITFQNDDKAQEVGRPRASRSGARVKCHDQAQGWPGPDAARESAPPVLNGPQTSAPIKKTPVAINLLLTKLS